MDAQQAALVVMATASLVLSAVLSFLNISGSGLFNNTIANLSEKYYDQVTPEPIAFGIAWGFIYTWNFVGSVYLLVSLTLPEEDSPVNIKPTLAPKEFLFGTFVAWLGTIGWFFAYDEENLELSLTLLLLSALSLYFSLGISYKVVYDNEANLKKRNKVMLWLVRILIQNGLALFATWLTVASTITLADVIIYKDSPGLNKAMFRGVLSMVEGSTISLAILISATVLWFILENFAVEKYCRYTYTVYPVLILALSALVARLQHLPDAQQNFILACIGLSVAAAAFLARIGLSIYKCVDPLDPYEEKLIPPS